jgi:SOS-response transcriptional repressor LexA
LERKIGASKGVLSRAMQKSTDIQSKWIQLIVENYPQYNSEWLITGNGRMLKEDNIPIAVPNKQDAGIPLLPISAFAGTFTEDMQVLEHECERFVVPSFKGADFLIPVKGSSMYPKYSSGDIVACKKLPLDTFFQWNKIYVLDTDQGALIKRIKQGSSGDTVLVVSENEKYPLFELHRSHIYNIALVLGVIRLE